MQTSIAIHKVCLFIVRCSLELELELYRIEFAFSFMAVNRLDQLMAADDHNNGDLLNDEEKLDLHITSFYSHLESELEISTALKEVTQKLPKDYLESMRQVAEKLKEDEWFYPSVNKLLGLQ